MEAGSVWLQKGRISTTQLRDLGYEALILLYCSNIRIANSPHLNLFYCIIIPP